MGDVSASQRLVSIAVDRRTAPLTGDHLLALELCCGECDRDRGVRPLESGMRGASNATASGQVLFANIMM